MEKTHLLVQSADYVIGVILMISIVLGSAGNIVAIRYFITRPSRNANTVYFNYVYLFLAIFDLMTCLLAVIPMIVAFSPKRSLATQINNSGYVKEIWMILWVATTLSNPIMIGLLSTSRLLLLAYPHFKFKVWIAYTIPIANFVINIAIRMALRLSGYVQVVCWNTIIGCEYFPLPDELNASISWFKMIGWRLFDIIQMGCPIPLVGISCFASIVMLKKHKKENMKNRKLADATITVIIVTILYLILNTSQFGFYCFFMNFMREFSSMRDTRFKIFFQVFYKHFSSTFQLKYLFILCYHVPVSLNSAINPLLYLWRMQPFRTYVGQRGAHKSTKASSVATVFDTQRLSTTTMPGGQRFSKKSMPGVQRLSTTSMPGVQRCSISMPGKIMNGKTSRNEDNTKATMGQLSTTEMHKASFKENTDSKPMP